MDAVIYNKIESEADRIMNAIGGGYLNYASKLMSIFDGSTCVPQKIKFAPVKLTDSEAANSNFLYHSYINSDNPYAAIDVEIHFGQTTPFSLRSMFNQAYGVRSIKLTGNLQYCTSYCYMLDYAYYFKNIDMVFDFTSCTGSQSGLISTGGNNPYVTSLRFVPNTASVPINIKGFKMLDDASLISVANCLVANVSDKSLTLNDTPKANCATIMGTNDNGTFVADAQGSLSLSDFITNIKGWTLA